jgi:predicted nucleic acid-binding protein
VKGIADTGFLVAFANRNDQYHDWAMSVAGRVTEPLLTCEAVLAESAFHLRNVALVLAMLRDGLIALAFDCQDHLPQPRPSRAVMVTASPISPTFASSA